MAKPSLTPEQVEAGRRRICDVANRLFTEKGYRSVGMRDIGRELGWSAMAVYRYYKNKGEIFAAAREKALSDLADWMIAHSPPSGNPVERLRASMLAYADFAMRYPNEHRLAFDVHESGMDGLRLFTTTAMRAWHIVHKSASEAVEQSLLSGDPAEIVHLLWAGVHGIVELHLAERLVMGRDMESLVHPMIDAVLARYASSPAPVV